MSTNILEDLEEIRQNKLPAGSVEKMDSSDMDAGLVDKTDPSHADAGPAEKAETSIMDAGLVDKTDTSHADAGPVEKADTGNMHTEPAKKADSSRMDAGTIQKAGPARIIAEQMGRISHGESAAGHPGTANPGKLVAEHLAKLGPHGLENLRRGLYDEILGRQYLSPEESLSKGKALRKQFPRSEQGNWEVKKGRREGVDLIFAQEKDRIQELLPVRHERMAASAFAFYRAAAALMAYDLSTMPRTGINVQACGDAHISNFGIFQSPERELVFDINDFDETLPGPWEWDLKRLLTSVEICGRDRHFSEKERERAVLSAARTYRESMRRFSGLGNLEVWYEHLKMEDLYEANKKAMGEEAAKGIHLAMDKAFSKNNDKAISRLTHEVDGRLQIISNPPLVVPLREMTQVRNEETLKWMAGSRVEYRLSLPRERRSLIDRYEIVDIARKVVGVGSVGTRDWIMVMQGRENGDYLVLQMKEAGESALEPYVGRSQFPEHGRRVVEGQRAIQTAGDIMLGWSRMVDEKGKPSDYYVRQLWDGKGSIDLEAITPDGLAGVADLCAWVLAHAHAKTGNRHKIASYLGKADTYDKAMLRFAQAYADQNQADYEMFLQTL